MSLWNKFFGRQTVSDSGSLLVAQFGRFTDVNKSAIQYQAWDQAVLHYENKEYSQSLGDFLLYIQNEKQNNVITQESGKKFQLLQGSKAIDLIVQQGLIQAVCKVAKTDQLHIGFMRRLLDLNYELKYVRYGLSDDNTVSLLFETDLHDASPYKLYFALKELAIHADKQDDLLLHEFTFLHPIQSGKTETHSDQELDLKYNFLQHSITKAILLYETGRLKSEQYPTAAGYILLALLYKLDYLIKPEGKLMDRLETMHKQYFSINNTSNILQRLNKLKSELVVIKDLPENQLKKDLYDSVFTFGFTAPANINAAFEVIDRELHSVQWYLDNNYDEYIKAIMEYASGLSLFNYALPEVLKEVFTFVYRITEPDYFQSFAGYARLVDVQGLPDKSAVRDEIQAIEKKYRPMYPTLDFDYRSLQYQSVGLFLYSYLKMIRKAAYHKVK